MLIVSKKQRASAQPTSKLEAARELLIPVLLRQPTPLASADREFSDTQDAYKPV